MKIAYLLRGFHYIDKDTLGVRAWTSVAAIKYYNFVEQVLDNFIENVVKPLKKDHEVDYYFVTYNSNVSETFKNSLSIKMGAVKILFIESNSRNTSVNTLLTGIRWIDTGYDRYIISRNDMIFKKEIVDFFPNYQAGCFHYLFEEKKVNDCVRIGDNMWMIDGSLIGFIKVIEACSVSPQGKETFECFHGILKMVQCYYSHTCPIIKECWDTDTRYAYSLSCNPIYKLAGRESIN